MPRTSGDVEHNGGTGLSAVPIQMGQLRDYWELTKPRITRLVLVTTFGGAWLAAGGLPDPALLTVTLVGTALAAGSSSVLNNFIDRDADRNMARTRDRALPTGRITPRGALVWGLMLGAVAFAILTLGANLLAATLAVGTIMFYVLVYTAWLKRTTPMCTSIGGIAGAAPPLIGWAAVTGEIGLPAVALFGIMYLWQPPHFWALGIMRADEYRTAGFPMLPVVRGTRVTKRQMLLYTAALLPASLALVPLGIAGWLYGGLAAVLGTVYLGRTIAFARAEVTPAAARRLFFFSIFYLFGLFIAIIADHLWLAIIA